MALSALLSPASGTSVSEAHSQAGPLPSKRGEIGYQEGTNREDEKEAEQSAAGGGDTAALPSRHPADRSPEPDSSRSTAAASSANAPNAAEGSHDASSIFKLKLKRVPLYWGIRLTTLLLFILQSLLIGGTIAGWVVASMHVNASSTTTVETGDGAEETTTSSAIYVYVLFALALLMQLLFLERRIFYMRAERYAFLHPGEILPTSRRIPSSRANLGMNPFTRPSLPTYAVALAQSGHSTGDVEDSIIAVPPPPAYGNTSESRMVMTGYLRDSLRLQRPASVHTVMGERRERPISYDNIDAEVQDIRDAERARRLEDALSTLEGGFVESAREPGALRA